MEDTSGKTTNNNSFFVIELANKWDKWVGTMATLGKWYDQNIWKHNQPYWWYIGEVNHEFLGHGFPSHFWDSTDSTH